VQKYFVSIIHQIIHNGVIGEIRYGMKFEEAFMTEKVDLKLALCVLYKYTSFNFFI
jgi:hypothetical protein